jgi:hypothetical protein
MTAQCTDHMKNIRATVSLRNCFAVCKHAVQCMSNTNLLCVLYIVQCSESTIRRLTGHKHSSMAVVELPGSHWASALAHPLSPWARTVSRVITLAHPISPKPCNPASFKHAVFFAGGCSHVPPAQPEPQWFRVLLGFRGACWLCKARAASQSGFGEVEGIDALDFCEIYAGLMVCALHACIEFECKLTAVRLSHPSRCVCRAGPALQGI